MRMLTGVYQSVVILLAGGAYYVADFWLLRHYRQEAATESSDRSWRYTILMMGSWALLVAQPVLFPGLGLGIRAWWGLVVQAAGILLITGALVLHWWARVHLGHFYVEDVQLQDGQTVVETGPYSHVRHPVFVSFFLMAVGLVLVNPALTTLLMAIYVFVDFTRAARREEELLSRELPAYEAYMGRTGRFFPRGDR